MSHSSNQHAMTEVALALAMAFFSIMVLAMVSMSVENATESPSRINELFEVRQLHLQELAQRQKRSTAADDERFYLVYYRERFFDIELEPVSIPSLPTERPLVLGLPPKLSLSQAFEIQALINRPDAVITTLSPAWLTRLESMQ